jgi:hypothetical protein
MQQSEKLQSKEKLVKKGIGEKIRLKRAGQRGN